MIRKLLFLLLSILPLASNSQIAVEIDGLNYYLDDGESP